MGAFRTLTCKFVLYWRNNNGRNNLNLCFHNEISGNNISVLCLCSEEVFNISINYPLNYWNIGGDLAPRLGGREKIISQTKISELRFFRKNFHFTPKISDDLYFFWSSPMFSRFFLSFSRFSVSLLSKMSYMTHSSREKVLFDTFFTLFVLSTSQNIGGTDAWAVPTSSFLGGPSPSSPRSPPMIIGKHWTPAKLVHVAPLPSESTLIVRRFK